MTNLINLIVARLVLGAMLCFAEISDSDLLAILLNKRASSVGTSGAAKAAAFERIAKANGGVVSFDNASAVDPKYAPDLAYYWRQAGGKAVTSKGKNGTTFWTVSKLPNGKMAYMAEVAALVAELKAKLSAKTPKVDADAPTAPPAK